MYCEDSRCKYIAHSIIQNELADNMRCLIKTPEDLYGISAPRTDGSSTQITRFNYLEIDNLRGLMINVDFPIGPGKIGNKPVRIGSLIYLYKHHIELNCSPFYPYSMKKRFEELIDKAFD